VIFVLLLILQEESVYSKILYTIVNQSEYDISNYIPTQKFIDLPNQPLLEAADDFFITKEISDYTKNNSIILYNEI
jgi:hypothetical protein